MIRLSAEGRTLLDKLIGPRNWLDDQLRNLDPEDLSALRRGLRAVVATLEPHDDKTKASRQNKLTDTMPLLVAMRNSSRHETWLA
jgi:hypothetical protein